VDEHVAPQSGRAAGPAPPTAGRAGDSLRVRQRAQGAAHYRCCA